MATEVRANIQQTNSLKNLLFLLEAPVVPVMEKQLQNGTFILTGEKNFSADSSVYNNSPNVRGDLAWRLKDPIKVPSQEDPSIYLLIETKIFDIKLTGTDAYKDHDIVQGVSTNIAGTTETAHKNLLEQLEDLVKGNDLSISDNTIIQNFLSDLKANLNNFQKTGGVNVFVLKYNAMHDTYCTFLCTYGIGRNLQCLMNSKNFKLDPKAGDTFEKYYEESKNSSTSSVNAFLKTAVYTPTTSSDKHLAFLNKFLEIIQIF